MQKLQDHIIDPLFIFPYYRIASCKWREALEQFLRLLSYLFHALIIWKCLMLMTGTKHPIVTVLSSTGWPTLWRGDVLLLYKPAQFDVGDLVVFEIRERDIPIIHRIIQSHTRYINDYLIRTYVLISNMFVRNYLFAKSKRSPAFINKR